MDQYKDLAVVEGIVEACSLPEGKWITLSVGGKELAFKEGDWMYLAWSLPMELWGDHYEKVLTETVPLWPVGARIKHNGHHILRIWIPEKRLWIGPKTKWGKKQ